MMATGKRCAKCRGLHTLGVKQEWMAARRAPDTRFQGHGRGTVMTARYEFDPFPVYVCDKCYEVLVERKIAPKRRLGGSFFWGGLLLLPTVFLLALTGSLSSALRTAISVGLVIVCIAGGLMWLHQDPKLRRNQRRVLYPYVVKQLAEQGRPSVVLPDDMWLRQGGARTTPERASGQTEREGD